MALATLNIASFPIFSLIFLPLLFVLLRNKKDKNLPPGPRKLPIIGNLHELGAVPQRSLLKLSQKHGPLMYLKLGTIPTIVASSADTAKELMKTHDLDCCSRPVITAASRLAYGNSDILFSPYGGIWRELRKICIVEFFSSKKVQMFRPIREEEIDRMIESISSRLSSSTVDVSEETLAVANNITGRALLGKRFMDKETGEGSELPELIGESQAMFGGFFFGDYVKGFAWIDVVNGMRARLEKNYKVFDDFYQKVIEEHLENMGRDGSSEDTLHALLRIQKDAPHLTNEHIKGLLVDIFIGGSDTSSATVEWTMTELIKHPETLKRAQSEVRNLIGSKGKVEESDLPNLHYMKCVLKETMRLHPPAPLLVHRETINPFKINGFDVPPKTRVIINALAIGRDEKYWEDPEEFKPERFIGSSIDLKGQDFELIPFGAGRRICPGMHIGMAVVELALANLLYCFDWEMPEGMLKEDIDMSEAPGISVHRKTGLCLVAKKYDDN